MTRTRVGIYGIQGKWEHDHSIAIIKDGRVAFFMELERLTRIKHDNNLPDHVDKIIDSRNIPVSDSFSVVYTNSFSTNRFFQEARSSLLSRSGRISFSPKKEPISPDKTQTVEGTWRGKPAKGTLISHELAHAGSSLPFVGSFEENSLLIHVDGAASVSNCSAWHFASGNIQHLDHSHNFHRAVLNFSVNNLVHAILGTTMEQQLSVPGKLMGYASYGRFQKDVYDWLIENDFFFDYFADPKRFFASAAEAFGYDSENIDHQNQLMFDIAACIQYNLSQKIIEYIADWKDETRSDHLYYAGGCALNIKINASLINSRLFESVFIPPCCNDTGIGLGAAALDYFMKEGPLEIHGPFLNNFGTKPYTYGPDFSIDKVCSMLADGKVIGVCTGNAEAGPRALGHRSLLAIPTTTEIRDYVSMTLKQREWYRPLAPIVLESQMERLFEDYVPNPAMYYMLYEFNVKPSMSKKIPAVTHVDGSARGQIVRENDPDLELIVEILRTMKDDYDIPCLINTSFNRRGEPIVHTHHDALECAKRMGLAAVILDNEFRILSEWES